MSLTVQPGLSLIFIGSALNSLIFFFRNSKLRAEKPVSLSFSERELPARVPRQKFATKIYYYNLFYIYILYPGCFRLGGMVVLDYTPGLFTTSKLAFCGSF